MNFDLRKHLLEYDDVVNTHRKIFYKKRNEILEADPKKLEEILFRIAKKQGVKKEEIEKKKNEIGDQFSEIAKFLLLKTMDSLWVSHLEEMDYLKDKVSLRAYGQIDPLVEYKNEGFKMFQLLLDLIEKNGLGAILSLAKQKEEVPQTITFSSSSNSFKKKPGRNDPCPCGSGKKYKDCCWPKYG